MCSTCESKRSELEWKLAKNETPKEPYLRKAEDMAPLGFVV